MGVDGGCQATRARYTLLPAQHAATEVLLAYFLALAMPLLLFLLTPLLLRPKQPLAYPLLRLLSGCWGCWARRGRRRSMESPAGAAATTQPSRVVCAAPALAAAPAAPAAGALAPLAPLSAAGKLAGPTAAVGCCRHGMLLLPSLPHRHAARRARLAGAASAHSAAGTASPPPPGRGIRTQATARA